jgi:hypothetical protein
MSEERPGYRLAHPVYLDVPMMMSFLAHLEGGVSVSESETTTATGARERVLKGRAGLRAKLWTIADADVGSEASLQKRDETSAESKTERHHTAASLFNVLYGYLTEDDQILVLEREDQLEDLRSGQLVEIAGEYLGNPIEDILAFFNSLFPYMTNDEPETELEPVSTAKAKRSGNPAKRAAAATTTAPSKDNGDSGEAEGLRMIIRMSSDIADAPVHDLLFRTEYGLQAVATVASEYYSRTTNEYLRAGDFRVVGKVTKVLRGDHTINLTRRTVLGAAGPELAQTVIQSMGEIEGMSLDVANPIVSAPAVQILPMAIFI